MTVAAIASLIQEDQSSLNVQAAAAMMTTDSHADLSDSETIRHADVKKKITKMG